MGSSFLLISLVVVLIAVFPAWRTYLAGDNLAVMYPNWLLFFHEDIISREFVRSTWLNGEYTRVDTRIVYEPSRIPEIAAADYSFDALRKATENFHRPAVVKGLFKGTAALEKWQEKGYLSKRLGEAPITVIHKAFFASHQSNKSELPVGPALDAVLDDEESLDYLFFPGLGSRLKSENNELIDNVGNTVREDLELDRIFPGFGTKSHKSFVGSQLIIGRGREIDSEEATGTGWHCAIANNYFIQVCRLCDILLPSSLYSDCNALIILVAA